jgi:hypothetical protein
LKEKMLERLKENPEDWYAKSYFEGNKKGKKKSCGYCSISGHTRATCLELKHARKVAVEACVAWRKRYVEVAKAQGVGIGTLVKYKSWNETHLGVVTDIHWHRLDHRILFSDKSHAHALVVKNATELGRGHGNATVQIPEAEGLYSMIEYYRDNAREFIGPIDPERIEAQFPANFLEGTDCLEDIFGDNEKSQDRVAAWAIAEWTPLQGFYENSES